MRVNRNFKNSIKFLNDNREAHFSAEISLRLFGHEPRLPKNNIEEVLENKRSPTTVPKTYKNPISFLNGNKPPQPKKMDKKVM